jgi:hypothetical protein
MDNVGVARINTQLFQHESCAAFRDVVTNAIKTFLQQVMYEARACEDSDVRGVVQDRFQKGVESLQTASDRTLEEYVLELRSQTPLLPTLYRTVYVVFASLVFDNQVPVTIDRMRIDYVHGMVALFRMVFATDVIMSGEYLLSMRDVERVIATESIIRRALVHEQSTGIQYTASERAAEQWTYNASTQQPPPPPPPPPLPAVLMATHITPQTAAALAPSPNTRRTIASGWGSNVVADTATAKGSTSGDTEIEESATSRAASSKSGAKSAATAKSARASTIASDGLDVLSHINNRAPHGAHLPIPAPPSLMSAGTQGVEDGSQALLLHGSEHDFTMEVARRLNVPHDQILSGITAADSASQVV